MTTDEITGQVIGAAIRVHRAIGPGLLESTYEACLAAELDDLDLSYERQLALPATYKGKRIECAYRVDFLIERRVIVELKCVSELDKVHLSQLLTYLKHSGCTTGLLINFNVAMLRDGIRRAVLGKAEP